VLRGSSCALALACALSGCATSPGTGAGPEAAGQRALGTLVSPEGHVVASYGPLRTCSELRGYLDGQAAPLSRLASDPERGLVLMKLGAPQGRPATFRAGRCLRAGEEVLVLDVSGGWNDAGLTLTEGSIAALSEGMARISAFGPPSRPGGPVVDPGGHVVGVTVGRSAARAGLPPPAGGQLDAVRESAVAAFLDEHGVPYRLSDFLQPMERTDLLRAAQGYVVHIQCLR
jgi:S1-C subfamily serine protease